MIKTGSRWYSPRLEQEITLIRWGHWGQPVLLFPTAGGDAAEPERMGLIGAIGPLIEAGRIKVFCCDSVAGRALAAKWGSVQHRCWLLNQFEDYVAHEAVPAIRADWLARAFGLGAEIGMRAGAQALTGHFESVDESGRLLLRLPDGRVQAFVHTRRTQRV